jgi:hypothetical protein
MNWIAIFNERDTSNHWSLKGTLEGRGRRKEEKGEERKREG